MRLSIWKTSVFLSTLIVLSCGSLFRLEGTLRVGARTYTLEPEDTKVLSKAFGRKVLKTIKLSDLITAGRSPEDFIFSGLIALLESYDVGGHRCLFTFSRKYMSDRSTYHLCIKDDRWVIIHPGAEHYHEISGKDATELIDLILSVEEKYRGGKAPP